MANYIFVPSLFAKNTFIENGISSDKLLQVPYGTNLDEFYKTDQKTKDFTIISAGQISVRKGSIYLLKAFEELNLNNCKLIMVGNIESDIKNKLKPYLLNKNIIFKNM